MSATRFLDTNVLLYAYDLDAPAKRAVALRLVEQGWSTPGETAICVQVLQEMHVNLVRQGISPAKATQIVRDFAAWPVVDNTLDLFQAGLDEQARCKSPSGTPHLVRRACLWRLRADHRRFQPRSRLRWRPRHQPIPLESMAGHVTKPTGAKVGSIS